MKEEYEEEDYESDLEKDLLAKGELKPCPFCGWKRTMTWHIGHYEKPWVVECCRCKAQGSHADTEEDAVELWNGRVKE